MVGAMQNLPDLKTKLCQARSFKVSLSLTSTQHHTQAHMPSLGWTVLALEDRSTQRTYQSQWFCEGQFNFLVAFRLGSCVC